MLIYPVDFNKKHEKKIKEYKLGDIFHKWKMPDMSMVDQNGVIIDLAVNEIEKYLRGLLWMDKLLSDNALLEHLKSRCNDMK